MAIIGISGCTTYDDTNQTITQPQPEQQPEQQPQELNSVDKYWAENYPKLNDTCPNCKQKAQLDEKTDKILIYYCKNCDAYYGVNNLDDVENLITMDFQDGVTPDKTFPAR